MFQALILHGDREEAWGFWERGGQPKGQGIPRACTTGSSPTRMEVFQYCRQPAWPYRGGIGGVGVDGTSSIHIPFDRCLEMLKGPLACGFLCLTAEGTSVVLAC